MHRAHFHDTHSHDDRVAGRHHRHQPRSHRHGPHDEPMHGHWRGGRGRAPRGDVRTAILMLVADEPMHGYQLMQAIADRTGGAWTPSPGAVSPPINQLEDEALVTATADAGRKLVTITDAGREHLDANRASGGDPFAGFDPAAPGA